MNQQQLRVSAFYSEIAETYDSEFEAKANYQIPHLLINAFDNAGFKSGSILDIGCGTGKLGAYIGPKFKMTGIEISACMAKKAAVRGYREVYWGPAEEVLQHIPTKSVDHVVALSSLYFIENIDLIAYESIRIARKSVFVSLEQFDEETRKAMLAKGIEIHNHSEKAFGKSIVTRNVHLWTRPHNGKSIQGDIVHKIIKR